MRQQKNAATDVVDQLQVNRIERIEFGNPNSTVEDNDHFASEEGNPLPDSEPVASSSQTYAITVSIFMGQNSPFSLTLSLPLIFITKDFKRLHCLFLFFFFLFLWFLLFSIFFLNIWFLPRWRSDDLAYL